jgi:hypothetical protein
MLNLIPLGLINWHACKTGVETKARAFSLLSHLFVMLFAPLSNAMGRNVVWTGFDSKQVSVRKKVVIVIRTETSFVPCRLKTQETLLIVLWDDCENIPMS